MNGSNPITNDEQALLYAARMNPIVFIALVLGVDMADVHIRMQNHLSRHDDCYIEEHRGIGKTTQMAARCAWEVGKHPNIRIKYVQHIKDKAMETVRSIRHIIESDLYKQIFPEIEPDEENWGSESFTVKRSKLGRDPTVQAEGINGRAGGRFDLLVGDDICDIQNAIQKPAERDKVKDAWNTNWMPMADHARGVPRVWKVGTPYHVSDITADWRKYNGERGSLLQQPVENFVSPWPEVWTPEILREKRELLGPVAFARAYELKPVSSEVLVFEQHWLDSALYTSIPSTDYEMIASFDFAYTEKAMKIAGASRGADPDWSVCLIAARDRRGHLWIKDMIRVRATYPEFKDRAIAACVRHGVTRAVGEGNGPQAGIVQQLNIEAPFPVTKVERVKDKISRATEKQSFVESRRFHIKSMENGDILAALQPLYDEMLMFPAGDHDDTVDAAIDLMDLAIRAGGFASEDRTDYTPARPDYASQMFGR